MIEELKSLGLTDGEIGVYLSLLRLGPSTNSPIARLAGFQSSTVYYCLNSLKEKGFVTYILRGNRHLFSAIEPEKISGIIDERIGRLGEQKISLEKVLPQLKAEQRLVENKPVAEVHEGFRAFRALFQNIRSELSKGDELRAFAIEQEADEPKELSIIFVQHNKALRAKGIKLRLIANKPMRKVFSKLYPDKFLEKYQQIRYTDEKMPVGVTICHDKVITHVFEGDRPVSFVITNKKHAEMYKTYFDDVWKRSEK